MKKIEQKQKINRKLSFEKFSFMKTENIWIFIYEIENLLF